MSVVTHTFVDSVKGGNGNCSAYRIQNWGYSVYVHHPETN